MIGPSGGTISFHGVQLNVPPGALDRDAFIRIGILWGKQVIPKMEKGAALLSPIVCCEPNGLKFKEKATLTIPHCAVNVEVGWELKVNIRPLILGQSSFPIIHKVGIFVLFKNENDLDADISHFKFN